MCLKYLYLCYSNVFTLVPSLAGENNQLLLATSRMWGLWMNSSGPDEVGCRSDEALQEFGVVRLYRTFLPSFLQGKKECMVLMC